MNRFRLVQTMLGLALGLTLCLGQACSVRSGTGDDDDPIDEREPMDAGEDDEPDAGPPDSGEPDASQDSFDGIVKLPPPMISRTEPDTEPDATDTTSAGKGDLETDTKQTGDEGDSSWNIEFDIDGDGVDDEVTIVYDDETKLQYTSWDGVIEAFCLDDSDADASFTLIYDHGTMEEILIWHSDCDEDDGVTYGCDVATDGSLGECGFCVFDTEWICSDSPDIGTEDVVRYECLCDVTCDAVESGLEVGLCEVTDDLDAAVEAAGEACKEEFAMDGCDALICDCSCTETAMICE